MSAVPATGSAGRPAPARLLGAAAAAALLGGCASLPREPGFADVRQTVAARTGKETRWIQGATGDRAVAEAVRAMLADTVTVEEAVQVALLNNRRLQAAYEELGIAQADLVQAGLLDNPVFSAETLFGDAKPELTFSVVQDFLSVLALSARRSVAASAFARAKLEVADRVLALAGEVRTGYYRLVADQQALSLFRQVVTATEAAAELAARQYQAGTLSRREQVLQQAFYAQTLLEVARGETQLATDREALNRLLGLWGPETGWALPARVLEAPDPAPTLERLETLAIDQRLDLAAARQDVETLARTLRLNRNYRLLRVFGIGFTVQRTEGGHSLKGPTVEFTLPLLNWGRATIAGLDAQRRQREKTLAALAVEIRSEVRAARTRLFAAHARAQYYRRVLLPLNETVVAETQKLYNGMLVGVYDLLLVRQNQITAARDYVAALGDFWEARADLERVVGGRVPGLAAEPGTAGPPRTEPGPSPAAPAPRREEPQGPAPAPGEHPR